MIEKTFFELIQVAVGSRICLSRTPLVEEWGELYAMAKKQSLVGICFAGVQRLVEQRQEPPEMLYLTWMGMAAKIQQRNEVINRQCVDLQKRLSADGMKGCIIKGQGVGLVYPEHLRGLRQSGDIDLYVGGGMKVVMAWVRKYKPETIGDYAHTHMDVFPDTDVEVHYRYGFLYNPWKNKKLQEWFERLQVYDTVNLAHGEINVPNPQFNAVYLMQHTYKHFFGEGVGLRQVMDYYCLLTTQADRVDKELLRKDIKLFGMEKFAGALMWVIKTVFDCDEMCLVCEPDEKEGGYLLDSIMQGGNFGHANRKDGHRSHLRILWEMAKYNKHMSLHYGYEAFGAPIWHLYHFFWKRTLGRV